MFFSYDVLLGFQYSCTHWEFGFCCMKRHQILPAMRISL